MTTADSAQMSLVGLCLTDDEVVALAAATGTPWPGPLPTLSTADGDDLMVAGQRGVRSLFARSIDRAGAASLCAPLLTARILLRTFVAGDDLLPLRGSILTCVYAVDGGALVEVVAPDGLHQFASMTRDELVAVVRSFLDTDDLPDAGYPCIGLDSDDSVALFLGSAGGIDRFEYDLDSGATRRTTTGLGRADVLAQVVDRLDVDAHGSTTVTAREEQR